MSIKKKIIYLIGILAFAVVIFTFLTRRNKDADGKGLRRYKVETMKVDSGWGYRILDDKTPIIAQPNVPGIPGNNGFKDEQSAMKIGTLVKKKLQRGIFPPSVSISELDSLEIDY